MDSLIPTNEETNATPTSGGKFGVLRNSNVGTDASILEQKATTGEAVPRKKISFSDEILPTSSSSSGSNNNNKNKSTVLKTNDEGKDGEDNMDLDR